jgi:hypothetical protein
LYSRLDHHHDGEYTHLRSSTEGSAGGDRSHGIARNAECFVNPPRHAHGTNYLWHIIDVTPQGRHHIAGEHLVRTPSVIRAVAHPHRTLQVTVIVRMTRRCVYSRFEYKKGGEYNRSAEYGEDERDTVARVRSDPTGQTR